MEIILTDSAKEELNKVLESRKNKDKVLRIFLAGYGWSGPSFGMALEEPKAEDTEVEADGFKFYIEDLAFENFDSFTIDYSNNWLRRGFSILPNGLKEQTSC